MFRCFLLVAPHASRLCALLFSYAAVILLTLSLLAHVSAQPYADVSNYHLESLSLIACLTTMQMGLFLFSDNTSSVFAVCVTVMLVLLVIFMITAPMLNMGVEIELPKADSPPLEMEQTTASVLSISLGKVMVHDGIDVDFVTNLMVLIDYHALVALE